jgi:hypothetical protein
MGGGGLYLRGGGLYSGVYGKTIGRLTLSTFATMQKILIVRKSLYKLFYTTLVYSRGFLDHAGNIATVLYIAFVDRNDC